VKNTWLLLLGFLSAFSCLAQNRVGNSFSSVVGTDLKKTSKESVYQKKVAVNYNFVNFKNTYNNREVMGGDPTFFNITNDDVTPAQESGWLANFEIRDDFRDDFDLIYSLGIFKPNFSVNENLTNDQMDMSMVGAEIKLMGLEIAQSDYSSMEVGLVLQLIDEFKIGIKSSIKISLQAN
jgi:hypothetical protein